MSEARTFIEASLRWVQASASGGGWVTASAPVSATVGFVQVGLSQTSAQGQVTIMDRGVPSHHKQGEKTPPEWTLTYLEAVTANMPSLRVATAGGASLPLLHLEIKEAVPELASTARYWMLHHATLLSQGRTEQVEGNQIQEVWRGLSVIGPTGSGYLAAP